MKNVECGQPHESVVAVDSPTHRYYPFFVKLHRCLGSEYLISPLIRRCVPKTYVELNVQVYQIHGRGMSTITVRNHTKCEPACVRTPDECNPILENWDEKRCACNCKYPYGPPKELACKENERYEAVQRVITAFVWSFSHLICNNNSLYKHVLTGEGMERIPNFGGKKKRQALSERKGNQSC